MVAEPSTDLLSHIVRALDAPLLLVPWPLASNEPQMLFSLNSSFGGTGHSDRRDKPLEIPYSTGLVHAAFFCELKQHRDSMRAFTFACQIIKLIVQRWIDDDKYCATENEFQRFVCPALLAIALDEQQDWKTLTQGHEMRETRRLNARVDHAGTVERFLVKRVCLPPIRAAISLVAPTQ